MPITKSGDLILDATVTSVQNIRRTRECKDDENYKDWMGLTCSDFKSVVCSQILVLGYSPAQIDTLKQACPDSCRVSCSDPQDWKEFMSKNNLSPEFPPDYPVEEWCDDNESYRGPHGKCDVHAKVNNCLWMSYFGYSDEQINDLLRNCPKSCSVPCTITPKQEEIASLNLTQSELFFPSRIPTSSPQKHTLQSSTSSSVNRRPYNYTSKGEKLKIFDDTILVHSSPQSKTILWTPVPIVCIIGSVLLFILTLVKITKKKQDAPEKKSRSASIELKSVKHKSPEISIIVSSKRAANNVSLEAIYISSKSKKSRKVVICEEDEVLYIHSVQKNNMRNKDKFFMNWKDGGMNVEEGNFSSYDISKDRGMGPIVYQR